MAILAYVLATDSLRHFPMELFGVLALVYLY